MGQAGSVSSPISTGGGGTFFEQHVGAQFLALLLVRGIPPVMTDCQLAEVHFQAGHLGWRTDDLLLIGENGAGLTRKLAAQVKRRFTVSSADEECRKTFSSFWDDYTSSDRFDLSVDRLALVTLRGSDVLLDGLGSLLDCARVSSSSADFAHRLGVQGMLSKKSGQHMEVIRGIVTDHIGQPPDEDMLWMFLRVVHLLSYDLNTSTAQTEASILTLLAQTAVGTDPLAIARGTWRELLEMIGVSGMPAAGSYTRETLPEELRNRHASVSTPESTALRALRTHTDVVLDGIRGSVGGALTLPRDGLLATALAKLEEAQVLVVVAPAGYGKSALIKSLIEPLRKDHFCIAFRAEEFAFPHLDTTLAHASITGDRLLSTLAAQGQKLILIESVERLLEAPVRDAFSDLLRKAEHDASLKIILTCRDYSFETVRTSLLSRSALSHDALVVPGLSDEELDQAASELPRLQVPLANARLRRLLSSPYMLDLAARLNWDAGEVTPVDELTFRARCWAEFVRRDGFTGGNMPARRERTFDELALRRARSLRPFVHHEDLDGAAIDALVADGLVIKAEEGVLAAPAHDVLEDWAVLHWLRAKFASSEGDVASIAVEIGGAPALRRGYRKWLNEMLATQPQRADTFVQDAIEAENLPPFFRDDTLVGILLSDAAGGFISRNRGLLAANDDALLVRLLQLLRVACKRAPDWLPLAERISSALLVPSGPGWGSVMGLVADRVSYMLPAQLGLLVGFLEDWIRGISVWSPAPDGFNDAGRLAFALLDHLAGWGEEKVRERVLSVLYRIPLAQRERFELLMDRAANLSRRDALDEGDLTPVEFAQHLIPGVESSFVCRDLPDHMAHLTIAKLCLTDADRYDRDGGGMDVDRHFGITDSYAYRFFPPSAIRGPFYALLRNDPRTGRDLILHLANHAGEWYGEQKWPYDRLESASKITLVIDEGQQIEQWANWRLYGLYRSTSVGPYALQSALMALERWLLEVVENEAVSSETIESWLLYLVLNTNNVAVTAVVASICVARPDRIGRAALPLIRSRDIQRLDISRRTGDMGGTPASTIPSSIAGDAIFNNERRTSDALEHTKRGLEDVAVRLQFGPLRDEVWEIFDAERTALGEPSGQSEEDKLWRLALHRMDVRGYRVADPAVDNLPPEVQSEENVVVFTTGELESDLDEMVSKSQTEQSVQVADMQLFNWGHAAWRHSSNAALDEWRAMLSAAQTRSAERRPVLEFMEGGPDLIAAVCVRDHLEELGAEERAWCVEMLVTAVERYADEAPWMIAHAESMITPDQAAAFALPRLLAEPASDVETDKVTSAMTKALTHHIRAVVKSAAAGVGTYLGRHPTKVDITMAGALALHRRLWSEAREAEKARPHSNRRQNLDLDRVAAQEVRARLVSASINGEHEIEALELSNPSTWAAAQLIMWVARHWGETPLALGLFKRVAQSLVADWTRYQRDRHGRQRDIMAEYWFSETIASFVLTLPADVALEVCRPFLDAAPEHPEEVARFVDHLVQAEDREDGATCFWEVWRAFAETFCKFVSAEDLSRSHSGHGTLLRSVLLSVGWKIGVMSWHRLEGHEPDVDALPAKLPPVIKVLGAYSSYLYHIGEKSLPKGFLVIAELMQRGADDGLPGEGNTLFTLESVLQRYVYGEPHRLKSDPALRESVLFILDRLVEAGSPAAYRMRDDFVTPMWVSAGMASA